MTAELQRLKANMHQPRLSTFLAIIAVILAGGTATPSAWAGSFVTLMPLRDSAGLPRVVNQRTEQQPVRSDLIECATPIFDFGRIRGGGRITCSFPIKNVSNNIVQVDFRPCCSGTCNFRDPIILPGQTIFIHRTLSTKYGSGRVTINLRATAIAIPTPKWLGYLMRIANNQCNELRQKILFSDLIVRVSLAAKIAIR